MNDFLDDIEVEPPTDRRPPGSSSAWPAIAIGIVVLVSAGVAWKMWPRSRPVEPAPVAPVSTPTATPEPTAVPERPSLGSRAVAGVPPIEIPPLDKSDDLIRRLVGTLSTDPGLARWLGVEDLARRFVGAVGNIAEGHHPRKHLPDQKLPEPFEVVARGGASYIAPSSYKRYDPWVKLFVRLDPQAVARIYGQLRPLFRDAYREMGYPTGDFDRAVEQAIKRLVAVPVPDSPPRLEPKIKSWMYADPALESLTPAAKQMLRLGADNQRAVQAQLRAIAQALGM